MPSKVVNVVVTCSRGKSVPVEECVRLRSIGGRTLEDRFERWVSALEENEDRKIPAGSLYVGDHWHVSKSVPREAQKAGLRLNLWVCSAGYGLVPASADLVPYAATFSASNPDAVAPAHQDKKSQEWWRIQRTWHGPDPGQPRSLRELAELYPRAPLLIAASPRYLRALSRDLQDAADTLSNGHLMIFSATGAMPKGLEKAWVPGDARLQPRVGGSRQSLNARLVRLAIADAPRYPLELSIQRDRFKRIMQRAGPVPTYSRAPMTDEEVRRFVVRRVKSDPTATHSRLLRELRNSNRACEQSRFARIFKETQREDSSA